MAGKGELSFDILAKDKASAVLDKLGNSVGDTKSKVDKLGAGFDDSTAKSGKFADGIQGVGDKADEGERRMLGLGAGISGVSAVMAGPGAVGAAGYAQGLADLSDSVASFVIPTLQNLGEKFKATGQKAWEAAKQHKLATGLMVGGLVAVAAVVVAGIADHAAYRQSIRDMGRDMAKTGFSAESLAAKLREAEETSNFQGGSTKGLEQQRNVLREAAAEATQYAVDIGKTGVELLKIHAQQQQVNAAVEEFGPTSAQAKAEFEKLIEMAGAEPAADKIDTITEAAAGLRTEADKVRTAVDLMKESIFGTANVAIAADEAQEAWTAALADGETSATDLAVAGQNLITTQADLGVSGAELVATTAAVRQQFIDAMVAAGMTAEAATTLANRYGLIPGAVNTQVGMTGYQGVMERLSNVASAIASIPRRVNIGVGTTGWEFLHKAHGGFVSGPGTSTSDSIPSMLSDGEFVVNAAATRKNRALLEAVNSDALRLAPLRRMTAGGTSGGVAPAGRVVIDVRGGDDEMIRLIRKWVRTVGPLT